MEEPDLITDFVNRRIWAVVGVSQDPAKFGTRVFRTLREAGYTVYPVNPKGGELDGSPVYRSLADLPEKPEVVDLVVPPAVTERVVQAAYELDLTRIWMQPGSESEQAIQYCHDHRMQVVYGVCAMVHRWHWK